MAHIEHEQNSPYENHPARRFGLTLDEMRDYRVSADRFDEFIQADDISVEGLTLDYNTFGEFMFVTLVRPQVDLRITFYGCGFHEHRDRWILDEWYWYVPNPRPKNNQQSIIDKKEVQQVLKDRIAFVQTNLAPGLQSPHGKWFEFLADLTDEDGAWGEIQDLPGWLFDEDP
ncbi:hypothetical protein ACFLYO_01535 [Chloroflexota bacterium]